MANKKQSHKEALEAPYMHSKESEDAEYERDQEIVRAKFRFHDRPGSEMRFMYKKHSGKIESHRFQDGGVYDVPRGVAEHINKNCWQPTHEYIWKEDNSAQQQVTGRVQRAEFQPVGFESSMQSAGGNIYTVGNG